MSLSKTKEQVVNYATVNKQLHEALQSLFDECVIADMLGDLSDAVTGETMDKVRSALLAAEQLRAGDLVTPVAEGVYKLEWLEADVVSLKKLPSA